MAIPEIFKNLVLDKWYKALVYLGGVGFVLSLFVEVKGITNGQAQLIFSGFFLLGLGEWKNHKVAHWFEPPSVYTGGPALIKAPVRSPDALGITFDILGVILIILGVGSIVLRAIRG